MNNNKKNIGTLKNWNPNSFVNKMVRCGQILKLQTMNSEDNHELSPEVFNYHAK